MNARRLCSKSKGNERVSTAALVACLAEIDRRRLYLGLGHSSMFAYCVEKLRLSGDAAYKRIQAARAARKSALILHALRDGWLHLTAVVLLRPHLSAENAAELIAAAAHKTRWQVEEMLARRFPRSEELPMVMALPVPVAASGSELLPEPVDARREPSREAGFDRGSEEVAESVARGDGRASFVHNHGLVPEPVICRELVPEPVVPVVANSERVLEPVVRAVGASCPGSVASASVPAKVTPLAFERYALHLSFGKAVYEKLEHARALLGHRIPSGDLEEVLESVLDLAIVQLEKTKFAATTRPQRPRLSTRPRNIPAHVQRAVWERDGGRCTFVSASGHRCEARMPLEYDHSIPVARGGQSTIENVRLRCRAHNAYEAERVFGAGFMERKREDALRTACSGADGRHAVDGTRMRTQKPRSTANGTRSLTATST